MGLAPKGGNSKPAHHPATYAPSYNQYNHGHSSTAQHPYYTDMAPPPTPGIGELEVHIVALRDIPATHIPTQDIAIICHSTQHILRGLIPSGCLTKDMELHLIWIETAIIHIPSKVSSIIKLLVT